MPPTTQDLINILRDGGSNGIHADGIETALNIEHEPRTSTPTRTFVRNKITQEQLPIGSNKTGYFLINSEEELNKVISDLQDRINAMGIRIDSLRAGWQRRNQDRQNGGNWPK